MTKVHQTLMDRLNENSGAYVNSLKVAQALVKDDRQREIMLATIDTVDTANQKIRKALDPGFAVAPVC